MSKIILKLDETHKIVLNAFSAPDDWATSEDEFDTTVDERYQYTHPSQGWQWNDEVGAFVSPRPQDSDKETWSLTNSLQWVSDLVSPEPEEENTERIEIPGTGIEPGLPGDALEDN